jgi:hypothetical protein
MLENLDEEQKPGENTKKVCFSSDVQYNST